MGSPAVLKQAGGRARPSRQPLCYAQVRTRGNGHKRPEGGQGIPQARGRDKARGAVPGQSTCSSQRRPAPNALRRRRTFPPERQFPTRPGQLPCQARRRTSPEGPNRVSSSPGV
eukprot:6501028-Alexandrium_andersonii.AAC.1